MEIHKKIWPDYFDKVASGEKKFELRLADFEIKPGDTLVLEEWDPETRSYTGRKLTKKATYVIHTRDTKFHTPEEVEKYGWMVIQLD